MGPFYAQFDKPLKFDLVNVVVAQDGRRAIVEGVADEMTKTGIHFKCL